MMQIFAAIVLTILPGSWIIYGVRISGIPSPARFAMAVALSPAVVGLQLVLLEAVGVPFATSAYALVILNLPCTLLLVHHFRSERMTFDLKSWLPSLPPVALLCGIPVLIWSLIPGIRTYNWSTMLQTDIIYMIARNGINVEEANLAGLNLAYGWIGHSYWSLIGWIVGWAPTRIYPFTNVLWIIITFLLSYQLGRSGLGFHKATALLGVSLLFLGTNVVGMILLIVKGSNQWWERYFGDIRYSPFLSKFYAFDSMIWGMALLVAMALVYALALRRRVAPLDGLTVALLVGLGLIYPVLFPAGLVFAGCLLLLLITRLPQDLPKYTRWEIVRLVFAFFLSVIAVLLYLSVVTANREAVAFARSRRWDIFFKTIRFLGAMVPFMLIAALPAIRLILQGNGPVLLLALSALALAVAYVVIDLTQLEYKYVLAATICLAFLAATAFDPLFQQHPRLGWVSAIAVTIGLVIVNLLLVFQAGMHIPGNLSDGLPLDESSFWLSLSPSEPDSAWTTAIREDTPEDTVVIARRPGVQLSALINRSLYVPSDTQGGHLPGYNLDQRFYLLKQRGYGAGLYERRLGVVETLYSSDDNASIVQALHSLKELSRPVAIYFPGQDTYALRWLAKHAFGRSVIIDGRTTVWLIDNPGTLP